MEKPQIEIKDLKDIVYKVPSTSIDYFLEDLKDWIILKKQIMELEKITGKTCRIENSHILKWIDESDTGEHNNIINIQLINNKK